MSHYAGLDVSMKETVIAIVDQKGKLVHRGRTKSDPESIIQHLNMTGFKLERIGLESGSLSNWLVDQMNQRGLATICIDARKMAAVLSIRVNKTDDNDAYGIAEAMRCGMYKEVVLKSKASTQAATLMNCRKTLVHQKVQLINSVRGFLKTYGIRLGSSGEREFSLKVRNRLSEVLDLARIGIEGLLNCYEKLLLEIKTIEREIEEMARKDEDVQRLMTIPGVGLITAMTYKSEIDDPKRFEKSRDVGAYFGMTPRQYSSGETKKQGRISKCGSSEMRTLLTEAGMVCITRSKRWSRLKAWGLKVMRRHGAKKASVAVGRKLAVIMHRMLIEKADFAYGEEKPTLKKELSPA
jgi:transposase